MTGKQITYYAIKDEIPDMELIRQAVLKKAQEEPEPKPAMRTKAKLIALTAACLTLIFSSSAAFYAWNAGNNSSAPPGTDEDDGCSTSISSSLRGLPVENFSLSDNKNNGGSENNLSIWASITDFGDIFKYNNVACIAVVRVTDTAVKTADGKSITAGEQVSTAQVIRSVYKSPDASSIQIENDIYVKDLETGIDENSNLLRKGGVYVLPLCESGGEYTILGIYAFLFEIDDKGRVFSHSDEAEFKRYDGNNAEILINDLKKMCSNEDFLLASSPIGDKLQRLTLADVTLTGKSENQPSGDFVREFGFRYDFVINDIISQPSGEEALKLKINDAFSAYIKSYGEAKLTEQKRYLVFLNQETGGGDIFINSYDVAEIDGESNIEALYIGNPEYGGAEGYIFTPYNGYKISDLREKTERIAAYLQTQSR